MLRADLMGPIFKGRRGKWWREEGIGGQLRGLRNISYAHKNINLSAPEYSLSVKHCPD